MLRASWILIVCAFTAAACKDEEASRGATLLTGGQSGGGGGSFIVSEDNPWFVGPQPVTYCIDTDAASFSLAAPDAGKIIAEALDDWVQTVEKLQPKLANGDGNGLLSREFAFVASCAGDVDITFHLGKAAEAVQKRLVEFPRYTIGLAKLVRNATPTTRAKGFVWLAADRGVDRYAPPAIRVSPSDPRYSTLAPPPEGFWAKEPTLYNVLVHELGHVFGVTHQQGGVMDAAAPTISVHRVYDGGPGADVEGRPDASRRFSSQYYLFRGAAVLGLSSCARTPGYTKACFRTTNVLKDSRLELYAEGGFGPPGIPSGLPPTITTRTYGAATVHFSGRTYLAEANYPSKTAGTGYDFEHKAVLIAPAPLITAPETSPGGGYLQLISGSGELVAVVGDKDAPATPLVFRLTPSWSTRLVTKGGETMLQDPAFD